MLWADVGQAALVLVVQARVAARVLQVPATSASVEQLLSVSGRVASTARSRLSPSHLNELSCFHQWLVDEAGMLPHTAEQRAASTSKSTSLFAHLNLRREFEAGEEAHESDDEEKDGEEVASDEEKYGYYIHTSTLLLA